MNREKGIPSQPDFSAADPTEAFQLKAVRRFASTKEGREMLEGAQDRNDVFSVTERIDRARAARRARAEAYGYDPKFTGSKHPNFE